MALCVPMHVTFEAFVFCLGSSSFLIIFRPGRTLATKEQPKVLHVATECPTRMAIWVVDTAKEPKFNRALLRTESAFLEFAACYGVPDM